jgi:hypothetical protein
VGDRANCCISTVSRAELNITQRLVMQPCQELSSECRLSLSCLWRQI